MFSSSFYVRINVFHAIFAFESWAIAFFGMKVEFVNVIRSLKNNALGPKREHVHNFTDTQVYEFT